ncbi:MAG TPA: hypothetical protein VFR58_11105 [Flavisolibacter sp.]|nr:hypothetical protein [Flavisolibacter sp.]
MPRQNFLSRESFVIASEKQAKDSLLSIPAFASNIKLVAENKMIESFKFTYDMPHKDMQYHIGVSVQPLNEQYTRISLHGTHPNGHSFHNDTDMAIALYDFESAIQAALKGDASQYKPYEPKVKNSRKALQFAATLIASVGVFFLRKKLS